MHPRLRKLDFKVVLICTVFPTMHRIFKKDYRSEYFRFQVIVAHVLFRVKVQSGTLNHDERPIDVHINYPRPYPVLVRFTEW